MVDVDPHCIQTHKGADTLRVKRYFPVYALSSLGSDAAVGSKTQNRVVPFFIRDAEIQFRSCGSIDSIRYGQMQWWGQRLCLSCVPLFHYNSVFLLIILLFFVLCLQRSCT